MTTKTDRNINLGLMIKASERDALQTYARDKKYPSVSAAVRAAFPGIFREEVKEGRPVGYSPQRRTG